MVRWFDHIANLIAVRDVMRRDMITVDANDPIPNSEEHPIFKTRRQEEVVLVVDQGRPVGWLRPWAWGDAFEPSSTPPKRFGQILSPLDGDCFIAAGTSLLEAVEVFQQRNEECTLFVIGKGSIEGMVMFWDITDSPAFHACILTLTLGLEESALQLARTDVEFSMGALTECRKEKIIENSRAHRAHLDFIQASMFADKKEIMAQWAERGDFGEGWSMTKVRKVFKAAERARNFCAHVRDREKDVSDTPTTFTFPGELHSLVGDVRRLTEVISARYNEIEGISDTPPLLRGI